MNEHDAMIAIKSFFLYQFTYLKNVDAFTLPPWFVEARKQFSREQIHQMADEAREIVDYDPDEAFLEATKKLGW